MEMDGFVGVWGSPLGRIYELGVASECPMGKLFNMPLGVWGASIHWEW